MSGQQLKYVRTMAGFTVFPSSEVHADVAASLTWRLISAGFIDWDADGRPLCMGRSDSLDLDSRDDDTAALRAEWGVLEEESIGPDWLPTPENVNALPAPVRAYVHNLIATCDPAGTVRENTLLKDSNVGLQLMYRRAADAAAIGACIDPMSIETGEPS